MREPLRPLIVLLLLCSAGLAFAFEFKPMVFPSARTDALGGMHAALSDDLSVLMSNPAAYRSAPPQFSVAELTTDLNGPIFSLADLIFRIGGGADITALLQEADTQKLLSSLHAGATINGPLALGYIGNGLGFGLFNATSLVISTQGTVPTVTSEVREDLVFVAGYAFRIPLPDRWLSTLDVGFSIKTFTRGSVDWSESSLEFFSSLASPSSLLSQPVTTDVGFGFDTGALYNWNSFLSVGLVARNLVAPVARSTWANASDFSSGAIPDKSNGHAPIDLSMGVLLTPQFDFLADYVSSPKFMLDYSDMLDFWTHPATASNPLLHLGLGVEVTLLDILALRGGFGDGYFSAGVGLNLAVVQFGITMFGRELSTQPGLRPNYNLVISTLFRY